MNPSQRRESAIRSFLEQGLLDDEYPVAGFIDEEIVQEQVLTLNHAFANGAGSLHTVAAKSATLTPVLALLADAGLGCEVASLGELAMATAAGFPDEKIVFDSPAKTTRELRTALTRGLALNVDNFQELSRIDDFLASEESSSRIGFRINPQRGAGTIGAMSTATSTSKFGIGLHDPGARESLIAAYVARPWMNQIHVHSGSQGVALERMALGIRDVVELADEIDRRAGEPRVTHIDIGGGLPVNFDSDEITPTFADYRARLDAVVPGLLDGRRNVVTEFGRALLAKAGAIVAKVEYTKQTGGRRIAITHAGAQIAARTVFMPASWPLRLSVHKPDGTPSLAEETPQDIAGPCCFAGDLLAQGRPLPLAEQEDIVVAHDTGAYYFSAHYAYNALPRPAVYLLSGSDSMTWSVLRPQQSIDDLLIESGFHLPVAHLS